MISNLLDRTHHEIPLLFALSAVQVIAESRSIEGDEDTQLVDKCIEDWTEMLKSADNMERVAKNFHDEVNLYFIKV